MEKMVDSVSFAGAVAGVDFPIWTREMEETPAFGSWHHDRGCLQCA